MKLKSFRIKNYKSIQDTGEILLNDSRIAVLAGQNESGKSSVLEALNAFEQASFDKDSLPFDAGELAQEVACTFLLEKDDGDFWRDFEKSFADDFKLTHTANGDVLDVLKLEKAVKEFTLTRLANEAEGSKTLLMISDDLFQAINAAVREVKVDAEPTVQSEAKKEKRKIIDLTDKNSDVADIFWKNTPKIVLFNDFCDLLPDKFSIADLKANKKDAKGYKAVKNFEKIAKVDFLQLYALEDLKRDSATEKHNEAISVNFTKSWKQRVHTDNDVKIAYKFEKRNTEEESFINFYVETKDKQKIRPRLRSKGLVWFLSFWMELQASSNDSYLVILADEPGLYLHIRAQEDIIGVFEKLAEEGHQIIYSTHSPNLIKADHLERISLVVNDKNKGTRIENVTTSKIDSKNKQDALQPVAMAIGFSVSDFALSNKKNVLLEGVSDYFYYLGMRKLLCRKEGYAFVPGIGVRKQQTLVSFCVGYGIEWVAVFDDDSTRGNDSQKTFDDIKCHLFDGDAVLAQTKMYLTEGISGVENMFSVADLKLIDSKISEKEDASKTIGDKRKLVFAKSFYEKVENGTLTKKALSQSTIDNYNKVFDWIEDALHI